jgi:hypothetical protein
LESKLGFDAMTGISCGGSNLFSVKRLTPRSKSPHEANLGHLLGQHRLNRDGKAMNECANARSADFVFSWWEGKGFLDLIPEFSGVIQVGFEYGQLSVVVFHNAWKEQLGTFAKLTVCFSGEYFAGTAHMKARSQIRTFKELSRGSARTWRV